MSFNFETKITGGHRSIVHRLIHSSKNRQRKAGLVNLTMKTQVPVRLFGNAAKWSRQGLVKADFNDEHVLFLM